MFVDLQNMKMFKLVPRSLENIVFNFARSARVHTHNLHWFGWGDVQFPPPPPPAKTTITSYA